MAEYPMPLNRGDRGRKSPFTLPQLQDYAAGERTLEITQNGRLGFLV